MRISIILVFYMVFSASCNIGEHFRYYNVYMSVEDLNGLKEDAPVLSKGSQVGKVEKIRQEDSVYFVRLMLLNDFRLPLGSELRIVTDIDNTVAYLEIQVSHSKKYYEEDDTIPANSTILLNKNVILEEVEINYDTIDESIKRLLR
jgi:ABC-type transporter Mla subunit MlaD